MRPIRTAILTLGLGLGAGSVLADGTSLRIKVSATVPPQPCEYPNACAPKAASPMTPGHARIVDGRVLYVGPNPDVTRQGDLLTIRF